MSVSRTRSTVLAMLLAVAFIVFSVTLLTGAQPVNTVPVPDDRVIVTIRNENWEYIRVYASENGNTPYRLTSVESQQTAHTPLHIHPGAAYCFVLIPLSGHDPYTTPCENVDPGDTLYLSIANHLPYTTLVRGVRGNR